MKTTCLSSILSTAVAVLLAGAAHAQTTATTPPVGFYTLTINGSSDNPVSLPMVRDSVFSGTVAAPITATNFNVSAGVSSPGWTANQFQFSPPAQPLTFYVEFTTGQLRGLYYKITGNGTGSLDLDTEGDSLLSHNLPGAPTAALAAGDAITIRPYARIKDVLESNGVPIIEARPNEVTVKDDVLIPNYNQVGTNKAAVATLYYLQGTGWQLAGDEGENYDNFIFRPNEAFIIRRRNPANVDLTILGSVLMNRAISFVPGGNGSSANDIYVSINRPAAVSLNDSGLWNADQNLSLVKESPNDVNITDRVLMFTAGTGFNRAPAATFFFLAGQPAGQGWRQVGDEETPIGATVLIQPGTTFIVRKLAANPGRDLINDPNY